MFIVIVYESKIESTVSLINSNESLIIINLNPPK